ncbi:MAG: hypothetical protein ACRD9R_14750 [Pyrinomonadaceae bacterium]
MSTGTGAEAVRERECIHRKQGAAGGFYTGEEFVARLQRLRGKEATELTRKVGAFFWADAPRIRVWLCTDCAAELDI